MLIASPTIQIQLKATIFIRAYEVGDLKHAMHPILSFSSPGKSLLSGNISTHSLPGLALTHNWPSRISIRSPLHLGTKFKKNLTSCSILVPMPQIVPGVFNLADDGAAPTRLLIPDLSNSKPPLNWSSLRSKFTHTLPGASEPPKSRHRVSEA